jgi:hypothetical protein
LKSPCLWIFALSKTKHMHEENELMVILLLYRILVLFFFG